MVGEFTIAGGRFTARCVALLALLAARGPAPSLGQDLPSPAASLTVTPELTDQPRLGDAVTLTCRVTGLSNVSIRLLKMDDEGGLVTLVDSNGTVPSGDARIAPDPVRLVDPSAPAYSWAVTVSSLREADSAAYVCSVASGGNGTLNASASLFAFPARDFPVCTPNGSASLPVGTELSCLFPASGSSTEIDDNRGLWNWRSVGGGPELQVETTRPARADDDGSVYTCTAVVDGDTRRRTSCRIGPLEVAQPDGWTTGDLIGLVVGGGLVTLIVAMHYAFCNAPRWRRTKSYLLDIGSGSSFGGWGRRSSGQPATQGAERTLTDTAAVPSDGQTDAHTASQHVDPE